MTERKVAILRMLIVEGLSIKQIAGRLRCSKKTIDFHIGTIYEAMSIRPHNPWLCTRKAISLGILERSPKDMERVLRLEQVLRDVKALLKETEEEGKGRTTHLIAPLPPFSPLRKKG